MNLSKFNQKILYKFSAKVLPQYFHTITPLLNPCSKDLKSCVRRERIGPVMKNHCARMKEAVEKCPKPLPKSCPSKTPDSPASEAENPSDIYIRLRGEFKIRSTELTKFLKTSKNSILQDMRKQIDAAILQDIHDLRKILSSIDNKIKVLTDLDLKCAYANKLKALKLNDRASQSIKACNNRTEIAYRSLKKDIEDLVDDTCNKIDVIMKTITDCSNSKSPECLKDCIKSKGTEAVKLLDEVDHDVRKQMTDFEVTKEEYMRERKLLVKQISKECQEETSCLSDELSGLIRSLKSKSTDKSLKNDYKSF